MSSNILINVLDIYLDTENPRHDPINEQAKIIRHLVDKQRVKTLARHMCVNGVSPLDLIGLIKDENNNYIVVEGNRRLCSLLLLNDPSLAPSGEITYFKRLSLSSDKIPSSINCVLFENYEEAKEWMIVRHDGEQDGVGVRKWDAASKARNNLKNDRKDSNALTISLMDYSIEKGFLPTDNEDKIVTTASRYLGNPFFRKVFGIVSSRSEKNVLLNVPCREFDIMCEKFCSDLLQNTIVTSRSKKPDWEQYARTFSTAGIAPTQIVEVHSLSECLIASVKVEDRENNSGHDEIENSEIDNFPLVESPNNTLENEQPGTETSKPTAIVSLGQTQDPDQRKYIIPSDFNPRINDKILRRVFRELKNIEVDTNTLAVSCLIRAFLENVYIMYHKSIDGNYPGEKVNVVLGKVIGLIEKDEDNLTRPEKSAFKHLRKIQSRKDSPLSPDSLGANAHLASYPNAFTLKQEFDNISKILQYMMKYF